MLVDTEDEQVVLELLRQDSRQIWNISTIKRELAISRGRVEIAVAVLKEKDLVEIVKNGRSYIVRLVPATPREGLSTGEKMKEAGNR